MDGIFSVEMRPKQYVMDITISDQAHDQVLFERDLGAFSEVSIIECSALEIVRENGVLRIEIDRDMLQNVL